MQSANEKFESLSNMGYEKSKSCFLSYLQLILIPFLVYMYFVMGYFNVISLPVHKHSLILMGIIFLTSLVFARHNAIFARCFFKKNISSFNANLKDYIVKNLVGIGKYKKSNSSFDTFVQDQTKNLRNINYATVASSIFPTMGILGTFISIAISMPNFSSSSSGELEKEISILLSGVGTAFYVSIYGIVLSLWWTFFEKLGLSKFDNDIEKLKSNTQMFFWKKEEIEQAFLKENLSHFKEIGTILSSVTNEQFFTKLNKSIESKFEIFNKMIKTEEEAANLASKHVKESIKELNKAQQKHDDLSKVFTDVLKVVQKFSEQIQEFQVKSLENFHHVKNGQKNLNSTLQALNLSLESNMVKLLPMYEKFPNSLEKSQELILSTFAKTLDESVHKYWDESNLAAQSRYENLQGIDVDDLKQNVKNIEDESEKIISHLEKAIK